MRGATRRGARAPRRRSTRWLRADAAGALSATLAQVPDIERITTRIALLSARPRDLASLRDGLQAAAGAARSRCARCFIPGDACLLREIHDALATPDACLDLLVRAVAEEPAAMVRDGGVFARGFDAELDELRALSENAGQFLVDLETRERARTGIANLRVEYNKVHGFYIEVTHGQTDKVPDDYRRRQTLKNCRALHHAGTEGLRGQGAVGAGQGAGAREAAVRPAAGRPGAAHRRAADDRAARWPRSTRWSRWPRHALRHNWCAPQLVAEPCLDIVEGRHPVVENQIERFIANDCQLSRRTPPAADHRPEHGR